LTTSTPTSGGSSGTTAAGAAGTDGTVDAGFNENGELLGSEVTSGASAVGAPFTLAEPAWGSSNSLMLFAGILVIAVAVLPPLLWRRLGRLDNRVGAK